jgi:hypothetical protein
MYAKVFAQIYDGTLVTKGPWQALVTFQQMLVLADQDGAVDMTAVAISRRTTIPLEIIELGIAELLKPDPESRSPDEGGRRIVPLREGRSWGWLVVNYKHYRALKREEDRREYHRDYWHKRKKTQDTQQTQPNQPIAEAKADADAEAKAEAHAKRAPDPEDRRAEVVPLPELGSLAPGVVCAALKAAGVQRINPSNPDLMAFLSVGGTIEELLPLVPSALNKGDPFAYILKAAINKRKDAAASVGQMARGAVVAPVTVPGKSTGALAELADHAAQTQTPEAKAAARAAVQALKQRMNVS